MGLQMLWATTTLMKSRALNGCMGSMVSTPVAQIAHGPNAHTHHSDSRANKMGDQGQQHNQG